MRGAPWCMRGACVVRYGAGAGVHLEAITRGKAWPVLASPWNSCQPFSGELGAGVRWASSVWSGHICFSWFGRVKSGTDCSVQVITAFSGRVISDQIFWLGQMCQVGSGLVCRPDPCGT